MSRRNNKERRPIPGSRPFEPTDALQRELEHHLHELPTKRAACIPLLLAIQDEFGVVTPDAETWVAGSLDLPLVKIREVVSFYTMLKERPVGRQHIRVCRNISCTLMGAERLIDHMESRIGCAAGHRTADGELSWETVECLGACELGPILQWDNDYIGPLDPGKFDEIHSERRGEG